MKRQRSYTERNKLKKDCKIMGINKIIKHNERANSNLQNIIFLYVYMKWAKW